MNISLNSQLNYSTLFAFLFGLSISLVLTFCAGEDSSADGQSNSDLLALEARVSAIETAMPTDRALFEIGDWDMAAAQNFITLTWAFLGIDPQKVRDVQVLIRGDISVSFIPLENEGDIRWNDTELTLTRNGGGAFDNTGYDSTGFNRGWIIVSNER